MFTIDFTKPFMYKDVVYFNQGNLSSNNILRCKVVTGGDVSLKDYIGEVTFVTLSRKEINGVCKIIDDKNCIIDIYFPSNALEVGVNTLEIILTKGSGSNTVVAQSPTIKYEVWRGITTGNGVQGDNNYPILIDLISSVNNVVRVANNASATANASLKQTAKMLEDVDNALVKANNTINATNNAKNEALEAVKDVKNAIAAGTQDLEVKNARGKYSSLNERLDNLDKDLLKAKDMAAIPIVTESNFTTIENTVDGYFEDIKIEGKTLVNLGNKVLKYENIYMGVEFIRPLDPDTEYTFILSGFNSSKFTHHICTNGDGSQPIYNGSSNKIVNFTTPANLTNDNRMIYIYPKQGYTITQDDINNLKPIILEGNFTQNPPSYFEGMKSVGDDVDEIVVTSIKGDGNLIDPNSLLINKSINPQGALSSDPGRVATGYIRVEENTKYYFKGTNYYPNAPTRSYYCFYDINKKLIGDRDFFDNYIFTTPKGCAYVRLFTHSASPVIGTPLSSLENVIYELYKGTSPRENIHKSDKKKVLYYDTESQTWKKPILREWDSIEKYSDDKYYYHKRSEERVYQEGDKSNPNVITDETNTVYKLEKEKVYECTPIDLITFENETNYLIESGAISPKSNLKCVSFIGNVINTLKEKVSYLEDKLYKTNLANFTVALNALDTKLKLEQLTKTPR